MKKMKTALMMSVALLGGCLSSNQAAETVQRAGYSNVRVVQRHDATASRGCVREMRWAAFTVAGTHNGRVQNLSVCCSFDRCAITF